MLFMMNMIEIIIFIQVIKYNLISTLASILILIVFTIIEEILIYICDKSDSLYLIPKPIEFTRFCFYTFLIATIMYIIFT